MAGALQYEYPLHIARGKQAQSQRGLTGLLVAELGEENLREVLAGDLAELTGKLPEFGFFQPLPDDCVDQALPGHASRIIKKLRKSKLAARYLASIEQFRCSGARPGGTGAVLLSGAPLFARGRLAFPFTAALPGALVVRAAPFR